MCLQRYKGKVRLHLRNYILEEEEYVLVPMNRGVVLDKQQTRDLLCALTELGNVIKKVSRLLISPLELYGNILCTAFYI